MDKLIKLFTSYDISLKLKENGFNELCIAYYVQKLSGTPLRLIWEENLTNPIKNSEDFNLTAPTYQQVFDWFRETHNIEISIPAVRFKDKGKFYGGSVKRIEWDFGKSYGSNHINYYDAIDKGINEALKLL